MKRMLIAATVALSSAGTAMAVAGSEDPFRRDTAPAQAVDQTEAVGQVVMVNQNTRRIAVRQDDGSRVVVRVPPEIQNLGQVRAGARVRMGYVRATALALARSGATVAAEEEARLAPRGVSPGETVAATREMTAVIDEIDRGRRELAVRGPDGNPLRLQVPAGTPGYEDAKAGEAVVLRYTEAVALTLAPMEPGRMP